MVEIWTKRRYRQWLHRQRPLRLRSDEVSDDEVVRAIRSVPRHFAVSVVQHKNNFNTATANSVAVTVTATGSGNLLAVVATNTNSRTVTSVSDGTTNFTQAINALASNTNTTRFCDIWYLLSSASGKTTITVNYSTGSGSYTKNVEVWEVSGLTGCLFDIANNSITQASSTTITGAAVTTTSTIGFIAAGYQRCDSTTTISSNPAAGNEFTSGGDIVNVGLGAVSLISSTAVSHTPQWTVSSAQTDIACSTAAFRATATGLDDDGLTYQQVTRW